MTLHFVRGKVLGLIFRCIFVGLIWPSGDAFLPQENKFNRKGREGRNGFGW